VVTSEGPYFDELAVGQVFANAPSYTLTDGRAAVHQMIVGDRLRLPLDDVLARKVSGVAPLAHPAFVWDVAIGQSTIVTQHVKANLFYRGLVFRRLPAIGDTLTTVTKVEGLRQNTRREGRAPTGLVALRIETKDQEERSILGFWRCAMLPLRNDQETGLRDDLDSIGAGVDLEVISGSAASWDMSVFGPAGDTQNLVEGLSIDVIGADVVSSAPELARLTLNIASVHHDAAAGGGQRLVYGGHTIGIALAQAVRVLPDMATVLGWHGCDHLGPVHEGDALSSSITVEKIDVDSSLGLVAHLRSRVFAGDARRPVLDWRFVALFPPVLTPSKLETQR